MNKIFFVITVLLVAFIMASVDTVPLMSGSSGLVAQEPVVATGISIDRELVPILSGEQLDQIIHKGEKIPLDKTTKIIGWDSWHTHLMYEDTVSKYALLEGSVIKLRVEPAVTEYKKFNLFYLLAGAYLIFLLAAYLFYKHNNELGFITTILPGVVCAIMGAIFLISIDALAASIVVVAFFVATIPFGPTGDKGEQIKICFPLGAGAMSMAMILVSFI